MTTTAIKQTPEQALALRALSLAKGSVGLTRANDKKQITKILNLFDLDFADENGKPYAFCAAGASWCYLKALLQIRKIPYTSENIVSVLKTLMPDFEKHHFKLSASCKVMVDDAVESGIWRHDATPHSDIQPGWLVFYDFANKGYAQHVGIVEQATPEHIIGPEFNTSSKDNANGGAVAIRVRSPKDVFGYIKPY